MDKNLPYNTATIRYLERQIGLRRQALAPLRFREAALLQWITKLKKDLRLLHSSLQEVEEKLQPFYILFVELRSEDFGRYPVVLQQKKLSGVAVPWIVSEEVSPGNDVSPFEPLWLKTARPILQAYHKLRIQMHYKEAALRILASARNKLLRKINLFEKIQIPTMEYQILQVRRYLQDLEAVQAAMQKMNKKKQLQANQHD
jgi:V/A-type H+-transporting ATPase subunit D